MNRTPEQPPRHPARPDQLPLTESELATLGAELFLKVSAEYPAAAHAQAIRLQQLVRTHHQPVVQLGNALERSVPELARVAEIGAKAHQTARKKRGYSDAPGHLRAEQVAIVVREVFALSALFNQTSDAQLHHILTVIYPAVAAHHPARGAALTAHLFTEQVRHYLQAQDA